MPITILDEERARKLELAKDPFIAARHAVLNSLSLYARHGPAVASTCYVWPSSICPVGCAHCNYASPKSLGRLVRPSIAAQPEAAMRVLNSMGLWKAVLSGGGEPMVEPDFCALFIAEVDSPNLEDIELITSAHFAAGPEQTRAQLEKLVAAWRSRGSSRKAATFTVRISLDWFHAERIGVGPAAMVISILGEEPFRDVGCYVRSVLLENDSTMIELAAELEGTLGPIVDYQQSLSLPDGREILIYYKNLIIDGRMSRRKLEELPVAMPRAAEAGVFGQRFTDDQGRQVPARVYNGPSVRHLDGLACLMEDNGYLKILDGSDPFRPARVDEFRSWADAIAFLYRDPLTVFLVDEGPDALAEVMSEGFPDSMSFSADSNQLYHLTDRLLATPKRQLYAMLRVLDIHERAGWVSGDRERVSEAWRLLEMPGMGADGAGT